jgi:hypothetical protein
MYFCSKISWDTGMVESSGFFLFDRSLPGKSYRGEESYKYLTFFCTCWFKKTPNNEAFFSQKVSQFSRKLFLKTQIEENILMGLT